MTSLHATPSLGSVSWFFFLQKKSPQFPTDRQEDGTEREGGKRPAVPRFHSPVRHGPCHLWASQQKKRSFAPWKPSCRMSMV